jgi:hypothetical protein
MTGILAFVKKNFLLLLILGLGAVSFLRTCSANKRIDSAINKLEKADSLLNTAKVVLDSADKKLGRAGDDVNSAIGILDRAGNSLKDMQDLNINILRNIHISQGNVNSIDKGKKQDQEKYLKRIDSIDLKIKELQNKINQ